MLEPVGLEHVAAETHLVDAEHFDVLEDVLCGAVRIRGEMKPVARITCQSGQRSNYSNPNRTNTYGKVDSDVLRAFRVLERLVEVLEAKQQSVSVPLLQSRDLHVRRQITDQLAALNE